MVTWFSQRTFLRQRLGVLSQMPRVAFATIQMQSEASRRSRAILLLALLVVIWGVNWVVAKKSLEYVSPIWVTAFRLVPMCIIFFVVCLATKQLRIPVRADLPVIFSIGWLHMVGFSVLVSVGAARRVALFKRALYTSPNSRLGGWHVGPHPDFAARRNGLD